ncbi:MAG: hypothetical protein ACJ75B_02665 [Flavisolibacter sp.]
MFDQILEMVKQRLGSNPEINSAIPAGQQEAVHQEVASHVTQGLANHASQLGVGGLLAQLQSGITSNSPITGAIEGGLVSSLASKFGLPPAVTGAIAGALPGILQKFAHKANDPNDTSITPDNITNSLSHVGSGGFGGLFNR